MSKKIMVKPTEEIVYSWIDSIVVADRSDYFSTLPKEQMLEIYKTQIILCRGLIIESIAEEKYYPLKDYIFDGKIVLNKRLWLDLPAFTLKTAAALLSRTASC